MAEKRAKSEDTSSAKREKEDKTVSQEQKYEYLDHTADVQLHAWGDDLKEAFEQCGVAMFGYMTELETVEESRTDSIEAEGDDMISLLYHFLDEFLFLFCAEPYFIIKRIRITEFDKINFKIKAEGYGETFDLSKHPQGTEVKAITYSNMQIYDEEGQHEVYVIIDI
ncbi:protein archease-like [Oscarella lobularis]|uniref:protein archease-like n=1 Tax=Oscarella lobularis TaxID=121494 RepID=UPI003313E857